MISGGADIAVASFFARPLYEFDRGREQTGYRPSLAYRIVSRTCDACPLTVAKVG